MLMDLLEGITQNPAVVVLALAIGTLGMAVVLTQKKSHNNENDNKEPLPPAFPGTMSEFLPKFFSPEAPMHMLDISRQINKRNSSNNGGVYCVNGFRSRPGIHIVCDYQTARSVLEDPKSTKWEPGNQFFRDTTNGANFITSSGHRWKHVRKSTMESFSSANIKKMTETIHAVVEEWCREVDLKMMALNNDNSNDSSSQTSPTAPVELAILDEMNQITATVIGKVAFDYDFSAQERATTLSNLETCWTEFGQKMGLNVFKQLPVTRWMFPGIRKAQRAAQEMSDLCQIMLDDYRSKLSKQQQAQPHKVIHAIVNDTEYDSDKERVRDMLAFVIAGFDTTANTLAFAFRELALNPELQADLRKSIRSSSNKSNGNGNNDDAQQQQHNNMYSSGNKFLRNVVRETLRMYPAAALGSVRQIHRPIRVANTEYVLPAKGIVLSTYYGIQRNEFVYPDPDQFLPSRWDNPTDEMTRCLLTFSAGSRNCQGQALATAELHQVLAQLIEKYEFNVVEAGKPANIVLFKPVGTILSVKKAPE